jgi:hypothetical protein
MSTTRPPCSCKCHTGAFGFYTCWLICCKELGQPKDELTADHHFPSGTALFDQVEKSLANEEPTFHDFVGGENLDKAEIETKGRHFTLALVKKRLYTAACRLAEFLDIPVHEIETEMAYLDSENLLGDATSPMGHDIAEWRALTKELQDLEAEIAAHARRGGQPS